ncbi:hypothetical protein [Brevibacillus laterosporus]|uniref:hypothetical protein n=1 Tax=Brevibacillus laterosporus TaxID=1465 RepID=UPI003D257C05
MNFSEPIVVALITAVSTGIVSVVLTQILAFVKIYQPIMQICVRTTHPGDNYEGLNEHNVMEIYKIVNDNDNYIYVDMKLLNLVESLYEDVANESRYEKNNNYNDFDEDRKLFNHVLVKYNQLKRKVQLPYERDYVFPYNYLKEKQERYNKLRRRYLSISSKDDE